MGLHLHLSQGHCIVHGASAPSPQPSALWLSQAAARAYLFQCCHLVAKAHGFQLFRLYSLNLADGTGQGPAGDALALSVAAPRSNWPCLQPRPYLLVNG